MALPRMFVGFSSTDIRWYRMMCAWKAHDHIEFDFADFQLDEAINSENEYYIKQVCRNKIRRADTYALLIGNNTSTKTTFVKWEVEVAVEKGCRLLGININNCRFKDSLCPTFFGSRSALFMPFSSRVVAKALKSWTPPILSNEWYYYTDDVYTSLGYRLIGNTAVLPSPPNPFAPGTPRPPWS